MKWVESKGGPLVVLEKELMNAWSGLRPSRPNCDLTNDLTTSAESDYSRACAIDDYVGIISIRGGHALVLGDEPLRTTWWPPLETTPGLLVRWWSAVNESRVIELMQRSSEASFEPRSLPFTVNSREMILSDAALTGNRLQDQGLTFELMPAVYSVETAFYRPDEKTSLWLHRLSPKALIE
jgi:hypothetical protein